MVLLAASKHASAETDYIGDGIVSDMDGRSMNRGVDRRSEEDVVGSLLNTLNQLFEDERFSRDPKLPPERELASELGISRRMLRRALERLEAAGKIWRHRGKGTFLGDRPVAASGQESWASSTSNPIEVMEARLELEPNLAALAALRATPVEVSHIQWCLTRSRSATDLETFELWDGRLHRAIAEASHNALLLALYDMVNTARHRTFWGKLQDAAVRSCSLELIAQQHEAFVEAIAHRDPNEARRRMHAHIATVRNSMFDREEMTEVHVASGT